eukprot:4065258-Alexandrium_andersonii.AAC.1
MSWSAPAPRIRSATTRTTRATATAPPPLRGLARLLRAGLARGRGGSRLSPSGTGSGVGGARDSGL